MAKLVLACARESGWLPRFDEGYLRALAGRVLPDHIRENPPLLHERDGVVSCVFNPVPSVRFCEDTGSHCLGMIYGSDAGWSRPTAPLPDGAYALVRVDGQRVELATDAAGSRSIFYYVDERLLLASSCQRALVAMLSSFEPDPEACAWMLSSGSLGPGLSWDRRIRALWPQSRLVLDRARWSHEVLTSPVTFAPAAQSRESARERVRQALSEVMGELQLDPSRWMLLLSGGTETRALLAFLRVPGRLRTLTWGQAGAEGRPGNDALVARKLAAHYDTEHSFFPLDLEGADLPTTFRRFVANTEGRVDDVAGYLDGFAVWKHLFEAGYTGFIRGDHGFGWIAVADAEHVTRSLEYTTCEELDNLRYVARRGTVQQRPEVLARASAESLETYRDRLYHSFRLPWVLGPLNEAKCGYVEACTPLLSRRLLGVARTLPDEHRSGKNLFRELVREHSPPVEFATSRATRPARGTLSDERVLAFLRSAVAEVSPYWPLERRASPFAPLTGRRPWSELRHVFKNAVRRGIFDRTRMVRYDVEHGIELFRWYIVGEMHRLLQADASALRPLPDAAPAGVRS